MIVAHIAGVPVEEMLTTLVPAFGTAGAAAAVEARSRLRERREKSQRLTRRRKR